MDRESEGGSSYMNSIPAIQSVGTGDPLLTAEEVAAKLKVSTDWVWDHSSRRLPYLPVIRMSDGVLRYRASGIEEFLQERERASNMRRKRR
jgi:predicted DNA-binding transcriptional regulator AlpA